MLCTPSINCHFWARDPAWGQERQLHQTSYLDIASLQEVLRLLHVIDLALYVSLLFSLIPYTLCLLCSLQHTIELSCSKRCSPKVAVAIIRALLCCLDLLHDQLLG